MITENLSTLKIHKLTQAQYDRELAAGNIDENALYLTPDEEIDLSLYATIEQMNEKSDKTHTHEIEDVNNLQTSLDELLQNAKTYTDNEVAKKSDTTHNHDSSYDAKGSANTALGSANSYTDTQISNMVGSSSVGTQITTHNTSTTAHNDIRVLITDLTTKLNNFLDVDDTTSDQLSEVLTMIDNNKGTLESLTTSKINVSDIIDNLETSSASKVLSANQGVIIKSLIDALQEELNNKVDPSTLTDYASKDELANGSVVAAKATIADASTYSTAIMTTGNTGITWDVTVPNIESLDTGVSFIIIFNQSSQVANPLLNVNGLGYKEIKRRLSNSARDIQDGYSNVWISPNKPYRVMYDGTYWILEGHEKPSVDDIYGLTASSTELNYCQGVTSNIQTQLDGKAESATLSNYYTKTEIDNMELITVDDIDAICGATIQSVNLNDGVVF